MRVVMIAGPNGAGKSTAAPRLLRGALGVTRFVNADTLARGLDALEPERVAFSAGRIMLEHLRALAEGGVDFAFETTLASRSFAPWLQRLKEKGYVLHLIFLHLPNPKMAVLRVADRVRLGGHNVPATTIRRRYERGLHNSFQLYMPLAESWWFYDNYSEWTPRLIACGLTPREVASGELILDDDAWSTLKERYS